MRIQLSGFLFTAVLGGTLLASAGPSFADPEHEKQRDDRRDRHDEKPRDDHRDDRREERHDRRDERQDRREDHREDRRREERREDHRETRRVEVRDRHRPYEAPPAVRYERHTDRRGYVWINGGYDWR